MEAFLKRTYYDPSNPAGFSSVQKLTRAAKDAGFVHSSYAKVKAWLLTQETYSISKPAIKKFPRASVRSAGAFGLDNQWTADLIDFNLLSSQNDNYSYVLVLMDQFSRYAWTAPLERKTPILVSKVLQQIFQQGRKPRYAFYSDKGGEFTGKEVRQLLIENNIKQYFTSNETKSSSVERLIRTLKGPIYKYFLYKQNHKWVSILPDVTEAYNKRVHRALDRAPIEVTPENEELVRYQQDIINRGKKFNPTASHPLASKSSTDTSAVHTDSSKQTSNMDSKKQTIDPEKPPFKVPQTPAPISVKPKYKVGQIVRISRLKQVFSKSYDHQYTTELFTIVTVFKRDGIPLYNLKDFKQESVTGSFYEQELLPATTPKNGIYKIDKVLKTRGKGRNKESLVQWFLWPKSHATWVKSKTIKDLPGRSKSQ